MKKGQLFALDFLMSTILVLLAVALLLRGIELTQYNEQEQRIFFELKSTANNASDLLVGNPQINCELEDAKFKLMNCVDTAIFDGLNIGQVRQALGIPPKYGFTVDSTDSRFKKVKSGTQSTKDFFEVKRKVMLSPGVINRTVYNTTFRNTNPAVISVRVWVN